jgi:SH3 domain-containing YSC84-like protein 1
MKTSHPKAMKCCISLFAFALAVVLLDPVPAVAASEEQLLVDKARITFESFMTDPDMAYLKEHLKEAKGILIIPSLLKAGFVLGGSGGSGVLLAYDAERNGWSQPAFYTVGSVSFGLQIGGEAAEVVMMLRTQKAVDALLATSAKLGADSSISAGPKGMGAASNVKADIFSFSRSKGAFAGLALDGSVVATRDQWNEAYYGKPASPVDILVKNSVSNPGSEELRRLIEKYAAN